MLTKQRKILVGLLSIFCLFPTLSLAMPMHYSLSGIIQQEGSSRDVTGSIVIESEFVVQTYENRLDQWLAGTLTGNPYVEYWGGYYDWSDFTLYVDGEKKVEKESGQINNFFTHYYTLQDGDPVRSSRNIFDSSGSSDDSSVSWITSANQEPWYMFNASDINDVNFTTTDFAMGIFNWQNEQERFLTDLKLTATLVPAPVPEPATLLLLGSGVIGLVAVRRRKG